MRVHVLFTLLTWINNMHYFKILSINISTTVKFAHHSEKRKQPIYVFFIVQLIDLKDPVNICDYNI